MNKGTKENPYGKPGYAIKVSCANPEATDCNECKYLVGFGRGRKLWYCGYCPAHCALHEVIKGARVSNPSDSEIWGCIWCKHYHLKLTSDTCSDCLASESLINYRPQEAAFDLAQKWQVDESKLYPPQIEKNADE